MNRFFPDVPEPSRRPRSDAAREKLLQMLKVRDATLELKVRAEQRASDVTSSVTGVVAFLLGMTAVTLLRGESDISLGVLWVSAGIFSALVLARLPFIRRGYLRDLAKLQDPALNGDARPRSHSESDNDARPRSHSESDNGE